MTTRLPALDALRGILAVYVALGHTVRLFFPAIPWWMLHAAVWTFFALSGFVLARSYDGRPIDFVVRRFVRLWPLYAVCITLGSFARGTTPTAGALLFWPIPPLFTAPAADGPAWSLYYEMWAAPAMAVLLPAVRQGRLFGCIMALSSIALVPLTQDSRFLYCTCFMIGAAAANFEIRLPSAPPAWTLWLGKISFSLYLTHGMLIDASIALGAGWRIGVAVLAMLPVGWIAWWLIERPTAARSRLVRFEAQKILASRKMGLDPSPLARAVR